MALEAGVYTLGHGTPASLGSIVTFFSSIHTRSLCCCRIRHHRSREVTQNRHATTQMGHCPTAFLPLRADGAGGDRAPHAISLKTAEVYGQETKGARDD